ncbi:MAG: methyltransferase domain-containing protein [candidate division NC10 bacterium]|nr:methyltransferase domain-containing protein [candidate division NC10 bacterium]
MRFLAFLAPWRLTYSDRGRLVGATELMDLPGADQDELARTLEDLAWINRWLGGIRLVRTELPPIFHGLRGPIRILDVATGYADIPRAIVRWGRQRHLAIKFEGLDHHDEILALARQASATYPEIHLQQANALDLPYPDGHFDVVLASLILHHMEGEEQVRLLRELYRVARRAVLVNDLRRGHWPFLLTWASLHVVSRSRLIHHDGPLSVRRGFLPNELLVLAREAGWTRARVSRHAFFRLALVGKKGPDPDMQPQMHTDKHR